VLLLLNPTITPGRRDLPLELYETELHVTGGRGAQFAFVRANYSVEVSGGGGVALWLVALGLLRCTPHAARIELCSYASHSCLPPPQTNPPLTTPPLQTSDAERIGVDQVAKILPGGKATGSEQREFSGLVLLSCIFCEGACVRIAKAVPPPHHQHPCLHRKICTPQSLHI